jgi:hypothetical protein
MEYAGLTTLEIKQFLGHTSYYRKSIYGYTKIALPLPQTLKKSIFLRNGTGRGFQVIK